LKEALVLRREPVDARGQDRLGRGRDLEALGCLRQPMCASLTRQDLRLDEGPDALFEEERIPLGSLDQEPLERLDGRVLTEQSPQEFIGRLGWQRVDAELPVVALPAPAVLVLGPVVDEQQQMGRREALDQSVEQRLGLGVDPVEILEHDEERLHLAFPEEQPLDAIERVLTTLRRLQVLPLGILNGDVQEPEEGRQGGLERPIQGEKLACRFLADLARVISCLDLEVRPEQVDDR
jgi:hypothetical protein